jgi:hypothetical protein
MMRTIHGAVTKLNLIILRFGVPLVKPIHNESLAPGTQNKMKHHDPDAFSESRHAGLNCGLDLRIARRHHKDLLNGN